MMFELDHLFICTSLGAPEAERLVEFGLTEGAQNTHPGQGTANRRFFFHNAMIELLWLRDSDEARSEAVARTRLYERCLYPLTHASPFGLCLRSASLQDSSDSQSGAARPFDSWEYRAPYIPKEVSMYLGSNSESFREPLLVYIPLSRRPDRLPPDRRQPIDHPAVLKEITRLRLSLPGTGLYSDALTSVGQFEWVSIEKSEQHLIQISFDGETRGGSKDFRPDLPLVFRW